MFFPISSTSLRIASANLLEISQTAPSDIQWYLIGIADIFCKRIIEEILNKIKKTTCEFQNYLTKRVSKGIIEENSKVIPKKFAKQLPNKLSKELLMWFFMKSSK